MNGHPDVCPDDLVAAAGGQPHRGGEEHLRQVPGDVSAGPELYWQSGQRDANAPAEVHSYPSARSGEPDACLRGAHPCSRKR
eukprot:scaffold942_cov260-Pinguiococcus_pyrenoidosus.AAC.15